MVISPTASLGAAVCRICHCGETSIPNNGARGGGEPLISPCHCRGTMGLYHRSCVERWLSASGKNDCEICNFKFQLKRKNRSWELFKADWCYIVMITILHVILHTVLNPLAIFLSYICWSAGLADHEGTGRDFKEFFGRMLMWTLGGLLAFANFVWFCGLCMFYDWTYQKWVTKNQVIHVVDQLSPDESLPFNPNPSFWAFVKGECGGIYLNLGPVRIAGQICVVMLIPFFVWCAYRSTMNGINATCSDCPRYAHGEWDETYGILWLILAALCMVVAITMVIAILCALVGGTLELYRLWKIDNQSLARDLSRRRRRPSPDVSVTYIPLQIMEDAERAVGSAGENRSSGTRIHVVEDEVGSAGSNRGRFTVTPVNGSHVAGHNVQYPANVDAEHPSPPSTVSSFSYSPDLESGANNGRSSANCPARCPLSTATLPRGAMPEPSLTPICVTADSSATRSNAAATPPDHLKTLP